MPVDHNPRTKILDPERRLDFLNPQPATCNPRPSILQILPSRLYTPSHEQPRAQSKTDAAAWTLGERAHGSWWHPLSSYYYYKYPRTIVLLPPSPRVPSSFRWPWATSIHFTYQKPCDWDPVAFIRTGAFCFATVHLTYECSPYILVPVVTKEELRLLVLRHGNSCCPSSYKPPSCKHFLTLSISRHTMRMLTRPIVETR